ncbi:MAG: translocation/assembly module TamB domain-containing protein [Longimicrobiales bacterium]
MSDATPDPGTTPPEEGQTATPPRRRSRLRVLARWLRRGGKGTVVLLSVVLVLALGCAAVLTQTGRGQRVVLDFALDRIRSSLAGSLSVGEIRSAGLLGGATLADVRLDAAGDRPFMRVDSIHLAYSPVSLLSGRPSLRSLTAWGLRVEISQYTEDQPLNVEELLVPAPPAADSAGGGMEIGLGRVRVEGALVEVLTPRAPDAKGPSVPSPVGEGRLSRLALEDLALEFDDALVRLGSTEPFTGFLARFRTDVYVMEEPVRVTGAQGRVRFGAAGLSVEEGFYTLPDTRLQGDLDLGPQATEGGAWALSGDLTTEDPGSLADFRWIDPRVPDGTLEGGVSFTAGGALDVDLRSLVLSLEASTLGLDGRIRMDDAVLLDGLEVRASPVVLSRLEPWLDRDLPLDGFVSGRATLSGPLTSLRAEGRLTLAPSGYLGRPTTAAFDGTLHSGSNPGATGLDLRIDPLNYSLLALMGMDTIPPARGSLEVRADGRVRGGVQFTARASHRPDDAGESSVEARGTIRQSPEGVWTADVEGDLTPLSLDALAVLAPEAGLTGQARGTLRAIGPLSDLEVSADVETGGGRLLLDATVDALDPARGYRVDLRVEDLAVEEMATAVPERSRLTGTLLVEGSGFSPDSVDARLEVVSGSSRYGGLRVDTAVASLRARDGLLTVDTLEAGLAGVWVEAMGTLGLVGRREGRLRASFAADSLIGLRSIFLGDEVVAADTLSELERQVLISEGRDLSVLPDTADVAMEGSARGTVEIVGSLDAMDITGSAAVVGARYGPNMVDSARITVTAHGVPSTAGSIDATVDAMGLSVLGRNFQEVHTTVSMSEWAGSATLDAVVQENETIEAVGDFRVDSTWAGAVDLREARATIDTLTYELTRPSRIEWDDASIAVDDLEVVRSGTEPMRLAASGRLSREGESDFDLQAEGLDLEIVARLAQRGDLELGGDVDLDLKVTGPASTPSINGSVHAHDPRYSTLVLDSIDGSLSYRSRAATVDLTAWRQGRQVFRTEGRVPVNLALDRGEGDLTVDAPMDLRVVADSMDAATVTGYLAFMEDVTGSISGDFRVRGTLDQPSPEGVLRIQDVGYTMEAIGVRHTGVTGTLTLNPDGTVDVDARARAGGTTTATGTLTLEPLANPTLDLSLEFQGFQAVDRADVEGALSGSLQLSGTYEFPFMQGSLRVDRGTLFLEEFARNSEIVDLTDPRLFDMVVDTAALSARPLLAEIQNPFLDHLRMDVDLSVPRDAWLRSSDMNVEMGGSLQVSYDRAKRDIVLVGELEALRGSYSVLGRNFDVESGTVSFIGTPGINPRLDIQAVTRVRRTSADRGDPLEVSANVTGTLTQPRVGLSTQEAGIAESDLVSYLVFGRPTSELASGQNAVLQGAAGSFVSGVAGTLATQLGSAFAQGVGVDYLSVSQAGDFSLQQGGAFAGTQIELGQYFGNDIFIVLILRPLDNQRFGGARVEVALTDLYNVEGFIESRFLRSALVGLDEITQDRILGLFVFREWGY